LWIFHFTFKIMNVPVRQCAVCRLRGEKNQFFRVVRTPDGGVFFDPRNRSQGRGVYICRKPDCIRKARQTDAAGRSLKTTVPAQVYADLAEAFRSRQPADWRPLLGFCIRAGKSVFGAEAVVQAVSRGRVKLILLDSDAAKNTRSRVEIAAKRSGISVRTPDRLGAAAGKPNCKCLGITDVQFAQSLSRLIHES
jgi:predicted RNA-binding protein YlxR (DUF448 family)/ribosomal protein L7Ae-like RNA K-turn-binding protein